jgi:hypothetical protein
MAGNSEISFIFLAIDSQYSFFLSKITNDRDGIEKKGQDTWHKEGRIITQRVKDWPEIKISRMCKKRSMIFLKKEPRDEYVYGLLQTGRKDTQRTTNNSIGVEQPRRDSKRPRNVKLWMDGLFQSRATAAIPVTSTATTAT